MGAGRILESSEISIGNGIHGDVGLLETPRVSINPATVITKTIGSWDALIRLRIPYQQEQIPLLQVPLKKHGALKLTTYSGKIWVFMCVLQTMYFLGHSMLSTPESNSSELGWYWSEPGRTGSVFPRITRQSKRCLRPSPSTGANLTLKTSSPKTLMRKMCSKSWEASKNEHKLGILAFQEDDCLGIGKFPSHTTNHPLCFRNARNHRTESLLCLPLRPQTSHISRSHFHCASSRWPADRFGMPGHEPEPWHLSSSSCGLQWRPFSPQAGPNLTWTGTLWGRGPCPRQSAESVRCQSMGIDRKQQRRQQKQKSKKSCYWRRSSSHCRRQRRTENRMSWYPCPWSYRSHCGSSRDWDQRLEGTGRELLVVQLRSTDIALQGRPCLTGGGTSKSLSLGNWVWPEKKYIPKKKIIKKQYNPHENPNGDAICKMKRHSSEPQWDESTDGTKDPKSMTCSWKSRSRWIPILPGRVHLQTVKDDNREGLDPFFRSGRKEHREETRERTSDYPDEEIDRFDPAKCKPRQGGRWVSGSL